MVGVKIKEFRFVVWDRSIPLSETSNFGLQFLPSRLSAFSLLKYAITYNARSSQSWLQLLWKKMLYFVVMADGFWNLHLKTKQVTTVWGAFYCEKLINLLITWATSVFYFLGFKWANRLTWTTKIFHGQLYQVLSQQFEAHFIVKN